MSFIKRWNADRILQDLRSCHAQVTSVYNDGFTSWACKQDLYRVKFELDKMLKDSPTFADEQEWVEQQQIWKVLNEKIPHK